MTLQNDQDPGWWRRGMTKRATYIVVAVCVAILIGALVFLAITGTSLF